MWQIGKFMTYLNIGRRRKQNDLESSFSPNIKKHKKKLEVFKRFSKLRFQIELKFPDNLK